MLFVCVENSCRSQMAEGFARERGQGRIEAWSAGSRPARELNPRAVLFMKEKGIDLRSHVSKGLDDLPERARWDWVITMGCGDACPHVQARHRLDWDLPDPRDLSDAEFRRVRDDIEQRVIGLIDAASEQSRG